MSDFKVWVTDSLDRVRSDRISESTADMALYGAKREYQSFQIVISTLEQGVEIKSIDFTPFTNGENTLNDNITVYREHYVEFFKNTKRSGMLCQELPGFIPDALIPAVDPQTRKPLGSGARFYAFPHKMNAGEHQPYFIDVQIPAGTPTGEYSSTYTVVTDKGNKSGKVNLTVWDIELSQIQAQKSFFGSWTPFSRLKTEEAARNRIFIKSNGDKEFQEYLREKYGYNTSNIGFWSGADIENPKMKTPPTVEEVSEKLKEFNPDLELFSYSADEIGHRKELFIPLKKWGQAMHKAGTKHLVVMPPKKELFDDGLGTGRSVVDIWVVLPKQYIQYKKNIDLAVAKGDTVWTYNCLVQDDYSPKFLLDYSLLEHRIHPGFINYSIKAEGFLFWLIDGYAKLEDPWTRLNVDAEEVWNGDGKLFYPGEAVGLSDTFVPSLRAKAIRDGFQDYELCFEIARRGKAAMAESYSKSIGADFENWTEDRKVLIENRIKLGQAFTRSDVK